MRYVHQSLIAAPPARVFAFHEQPGALEKLIPPWEEVRVVQRGASLSPGAVVIMRMRLAPPLPLWVTWEALHTLYEKDLFFQDVQRRGPFSRWVHTHRFLAEGDQTRLRDEIDFTLPLGPLGQLLGGARVLAQLERMFAFRHQVTRAECEVSPR